MSNYTIHCIGFEPQQQASIAAILDLAGSSLNSSWNIIDHTGSDIFMVNMNNKSSLKELIEHQDIPDDHIILVSEQPAENSTDHWFLAKKEFGPPSLRELTQLLNQIDVRLLEASMSNFSENTELQIENDVEDQVEEIEEKIKSSIDLGKTKHTKLRNPTRKLTAKNYLFGMLLQAKKNKNTRIIKLNNLPPLYISAQSNSCFFSGTEAELIQFCIASPRKISNKSISDTKFSKLLKNNLNQIIDQSLDALIGYAIVLASQGQLLEGQSARQLVMLKQLPKNNEIPVLNEFESIATLMIQQEHSLFDVAKQLQAPLTDIFNFYNICYYFEYIKVISLDKKPIPPKDEVNDENKNDKTLGGFLSSLFGK